MNEQDLKGVIVVQTVVIALLTVVLMLTIASCSRLDGIQIEQARQRNQVGSP